MTQRERGEVEIQRRYYAQTARTYDAMHVDVDEEHGVALAFLLAAIDLLQVKSILDIGSGTGRVMARLKEARADVFVLGIEPVAELRAVAYEKGIDKERLVDGDVLALEFGEGAFDMVCEFGVLHHIRRPDRAVAEMLRVSKKAIFISDSNNFGQGSPAGRILKQALNSCGLWPAANWFKTKGRGYQVSDGDGLAYSYSVFNNYAQIRAQCQCIHLLNTTNAGVNPYRTAQHVALLGVKK